jgi:cobalt-zinc-cadmium efflux system outer membrane protein
MKNTIYISFLSLFLALQLQAQRGVDSVLFSIAGKNKTIQTNQQYWEAKKLEFQIGLTPNNPKVDYDYLKGSPVGAGNQTDFTVTQSFDFPTVYAKKKQLSEEKTKQAEIQMTSTKQTILLEAKITCIQLVYKNKLQLEIVERKQNTEKLLSDFLRRLEKGEGNILDVNKARLQLLTINASFQENVSAINQLNQVLTSLNGGEIILFSDTAYPVIPILPNFETLEMEVETNDPIRAYMEQQRVIGQKQVELTKAMNLPKLETGYHYQAILGQRFNGIHFGVTIPIWENRNKLNAEEANLRLSDLSMQEHKNEHYYDIQQKHEKQANLRLQLNEYEELFASLNNVDLLNKSLRLGQISTIEYFMEMTYYFDALKNYLRIEMEYHQTVAELYKYSL